MSWRYLRPIQCLLLGALLAAELGCGGRRSRPDAFLIPAQDFFHSIQTLVLVQVTPSADLAVLEERLSELDSQISHEVEATGFAVVSAETSQEIWVRILDETGALYDRYTGLRDESKFAAAKGRFLKELVARFDADAGGLQTLEKLGWSDGDIRTVADEELLVDRERNRHAIRVALAPLRDRRPRATK